MDKPAAEVLEQLHAAWLERFGEPPPIIAEPEIMRRVLSQVLKRSGEASWRPDAVARSEESCPRRPACPEDDDRPTA